jgi:hypothetical protein
MLSRLRFAAACILLAATSSLAAPVVYHADLSGPAEAPPNASPGTGDADVTYDPLLHTLTIDVDFSGLLGTTTNAHIHCCTAVPGAATAGVATMTPTFLGFPAGVSAGSYFHVFDLTDATSWNAAYITANGGTPASAEAAFAIGLAEGRAYFNIHSSAFGGGEIRGFLAAVPEPATALLAALALAGMSLRQLRQRERLGR